MASFEIVRDQTSWGAMLQGTGWTSQPLGYNGQSYKHAANANQNIKAYWVLAVTGPVPGQSFGLYATWVADAANQSNAHYRLTYTLNNVYTNEDVFVDQTQAPSDVMVGGVGWKKIKDFVHDADGKLDDYSSVGVQLFCDGQPTGDVVADAMAANYIP